MNSRASRAGFRLALLSAPVLLSVGLVAPTAWAAAPAPVSELSVSTQDAVIYAEWSPSTETPYANACYLVGTTAPATPTDSGVTCSGVTSNPGYSFRGVGGQTYSLSVFSYRTTTSEYGSAVSKTITAVDAAPKPPANLRTRPSGETALSLRWSDNSANSDTKEFLVSYAAGTGFPPDSSAHTTQSTSDYFYGLAPGTVYTFAVRVRDLGGNLSAGALIRATTREPGIWQADNTGTGGAIGSTSLGYNYGTLTDAGSTITANDSIRAAYVDRFGNVKTAAFAPGPGWKDTQLARQNGPTHPLVAVGRPGFAIVGWTSKGGPYYKFQSISGGWSAIKHPTSNTADRLVGVSSDTGNRVHLLIQRTAGTGKGLWYITNGSGSWTKQFIAGSGPNDIGLLTRDLGTNRIVIVDRHRGATTETIRVAVVKATASKVAPLATWLSTTTRSVQWKPSSVAAYGGAVTLAVQRVTSSGSTADGPYVVYGTAALHKAPVRVAGTTARDIRTTVSMRGANKVLLSWQRVSPSWNPTQFGIWVSQRSRATSTSAWTFTAATRWTKSAYDVPSGAYMDKVGHIYLVYVTGTTDV